jgi:hypothetical protein
VMSEKDMEDAIVNNPKRYLGEDGLELLSRQYRIGGYIFDLLFHDRHGAKLIVEIQKGTLDRSHTYKIMDYYHGYRDQNPKEFIELMIVANIIPEERKKRLREWGIEFREIPESEFIDSTSVVVSPPLNSKEQQKVKPTNELVSVAINSDAMESYLLFKEQKNRFIEELSKIEEVSLRFNFKELNANSINTHKNWFACWIPHKWGVFKQSSAGVHFEFYHIRDKNSGIEYVRYPVGVESPLKREFHTHFKTDVVDSLKARNVDSKNCLLWLDPGYRGAKLLEPKHIPLNQDTWKYVLDGYLQLGSFIEVVGEVMKKYNNLGCFTEQLDFR